MVRGLVGVVASLTLPCLLSAQEGPVTDFRTQGAYTTAALEQALFPEGSQGYRVRGLGKLTIVLNMAFHSNSDQILPIFYPDLKKLGDVLTRYPDATLEIAGHTDDVGPEASNQRLSERRAARIRRYLVEAYAIPGTRLIATGYGESRPRAANTTPQGRRVNRRVEVVRLSP
jgi:outer membrane protein OmpA-like peptidoglycan-associated protein